MSILVVIFVYDIRHFIIPDLLTGLLLLSTLCLIGLEFYAGVPLETIALDFFAAFFAAIFFFGLWFVSKGAWLGFGDVKLAFPLALFVGAELTFSFVVWSFWIGAGVSILLVALSKMVRGKLRLPFLSSSLTIKSVVPFAPFLVVGCLMVYFFRLDVLTLFTF